MDWLRSNELNTKTDCSLFDKSSPSALSWCGLTHPTGLQNQQGRADLQADVVGEISCRVRGLQGLGDVLPVLLCHAGSGPGLFVPEGDAQFADEQRGGGL